MSNIAVDVMGGDFAPDEIIKGCLKAAPNIDSTLVLIGKEEVIRQKLTLYTPKVFDTSKIKIVNAEEVIEMTDSPTMAIRKKKNSSMVVGLKLVKENRVDGFISAGNSGALLAGATLLVGRIKGVERPAMAPFIPTQTGSALLIDCGANVDAKPQYLEQFARMGSIYLEECLKIKNPKVGLVNIGTEEEKGNQLVKETYQLLKECPNINFYGNIEARDIPQGLVDIIVCDGFTGNVILKFMEGFSKWLLTLIKDAFLKNLKTKVAALFMKNGIASIKGRFDVATKGGAPFLGINGLVVKSHGNSKEDEIYSTILQTEGFIKNQLVLKIKEKFAEDKKQTESSLKSQVVSKIKEKFTEDKN